MVTKNIYTVCSNIHARVLRGFRYVHDSKNYGVVEDWRFPTDVDRVTDDCDGFAIACRVLVREEGLESRLVVCQAETGEGHLVCAVGNYILDNRMRGVVTREKLERHGYKFLYVSGLEPGEPWRAVEN
jgi:predicted transglutaminase-like cysteine proteinase